METRESRLFTIRKHREFFVCQANVNHARLISFWTGREESNFTRNTGWRCWWLSDRAGIVATTYVTGEVGRGLQTFLNEAF